MFPFLLATERINFMLSVFTATLSPMLVMFLCILIGFVLNKKSFLPDNAATGASMAMISHTLCVITIPIMYALLTAVIK